VEEAGPALLLGGAGFRAPRGSSTRFTRGISTATGHWPGEERIDSAATSLHYRRANDSRAAFAPSGRATQPPPLGSSRGSSCRCPGMRCSRRSRMRSDALPDRGETDLACADCLFDLSAVGSRRRRRRRAAVQAAAAQQNGEGVQRPPQAPEAAGLTDAPSARWCGGGDRDARPVHHLRVPRLGTGRCASWMDCIGCGRTGRSPRIALRSQRGARTTCSHCRETRAA
jgi:hypothetical protein